MQRVLAIVIFFFLLFNSSLSFADEGQGESHNDPSTQTSADEESSNQTHASHEEETNENLGSEDNQQEEGNEVENNHSSEHSDQVVEEDSHNTEEDDHAAEEGHGSEEITESAPNYLVLSIFGLINLTFILIGIWNKLIRRRGNKNVYAK
ncbi:hypothetical protein [Bacillus coreaensis]